MSVGGHVVIVATSVVGLLVAAGPAVAQQESRGPHDVGPVLITSPLPASARPPHSPPGQSREKPLGRPHRKPQSGNLTDPVVQTSTSAPAAAQAFGQWEGLGVGYPGFTPTAVPPDTNMAVGPNHIVQWVNNAMVIFDKQGNVLQAPVADTTFWASATCNQLGGYSDPIVKYDRLADRWVVGEVAIPLFPGFFGEFAQCFAVSKTSDPTFTQDANGNNTAYYTWGYGFNGNLNDYDKIAVWPDGYYVNWNIFDSSGTNFLYPEACAWNRDDMLAGVAAPRFVCIKTLSNSYASLLSSDWDGSTPPPAGSPNYLMAVDTVLGVLDEWQFHVDYATPANSTLTGPIPVSGVAGFTAPCPTTQDCIAQPGTTQMVDALSDRLMYRLAYRNFGDHESIVANHTVSAGAGAANTGVRWYEVRDPGGTPTVYQQGTFAPDSDSRWMASIAMDKSGDIGVGYSVSSASTNPSIRYSGWEVGDPTGTLQAETHLVDGGGSQTGANRWGDYSAMQVDPADDCTFWYTQEYEAATQATDWNTRIGSFKFSSCGPVLASTTTTLGSSGNPSAYGQSVTFTATVAPAAGPGTPTGSVTFKDGAATLGSSALDASGVGVVSASSLAPGAHSITAIYSGDSTFGGGTSSVLTQTVDHAGTATALASSLNPSIYRTSVKFTATVTQSSGTATPTGSVTFKDGATSLGTATLSGGAASFSTSSLSAGSHSITAAYGGDSNYLSSVSGALSQAVSRAGTTTTVSSNANPSTYGQNVTFTGTVSPSTATGAVQFFDGAISLGSVTLSGGKASLSTAKLSGGPHSITATYGGDANYSGSTSSILTETVNLSSTTTSLTASPNPSVSGQTVTFTATVSRSGATGMVQFYDGAISLGSVTLSGGKASLPTAALSVGSHSITATYSGDTNYHGSTSSVLKQTVNLIGTTTALTSSLNPSVSGQTVTFTATVKPSSGTGTPTGTVKFLDGSTTLGSSTLTSGAATFSTTSLSVGTHSITAQYGGDTNYKASTSAVLTQTVKSH